MRKLWLCALVMWLATAVGTASAAPRARGHHATGTSQRAKPAKSRTTPTRSTKQRTATGKRGAKAIAKAPARGKGKPGRVAAAPTRGKGKGRVAAAAPPRRDLARVTIAGAVRAPGELHGRNPSIASTPAERTADAIDKILQGPLRFGTTGLYVVDAATGHELFAIHPDDPLNPASNVKLVSTATALDLLGPDFRYTTRLLGASPDPDGAVAGDVYLHGTYDPTLSASGLDQLARAAAAGGVRRIAGDVVVGGPSTRDGIYRARVQVAIEAGAPGQAPGITVTPSSDFVRVVNRATTGKRAKVKGRLDVASKLVDDNGHTRLEITVSGAIGKGKRVARTVSTKERHVFTAHLVRAALARAGVELSGDVHVAELEAYVAAASAAGRLPIVLAQRESAPLAEIVGQVNKRSINWLSDRIVATAAALTAGQQPSMGEAIDAMYGWLERNAGVSRKEAVLDTGSGLSYRTELSPRQLVKVLRVATGAAGPVDERQAACAEAFRRSLAIGGVDGTLRGRLRSALRGRVIGKTGTLTSVIALSGILEGKDGRQLAFSFVTNGHPNRRKQSVRAAHEELLRVLDRYLAETQAAAPATTPTVDMVPAAEPAAISEVDAVADDLTDDEPEAATDPAADPAGPADEPGPADQPGDSGT